ncbi:glycosyl transferase family 2 (plasmid) [Methanohalobium evestigatum Z-7303]|uniref:Glycosyl transferase family 2 n=1 Tax=Methanohalobium evestigatum (strain ATCC BAA-1072 / DSM 3721 / NBRC 107634 / OCM 161 / Z-7303) TaxID=644295 RepID=D7EBY3_METEZ|nr:glycosyltransferase family 2 protein [Methanohalobium evestigatum]ADI75105.1 glycosyl transferase family 2 [Methanohalobium evestigatum Z-7303]
MVKVSVIIPTYNRSQTVSKTIKSVLNQTYQDFEIIIVDDNSSDNTEFIIKSFSHFDSRVKYIKHNKNKGAPEARNTGIKNSKGDYIALLDDDDEWFPQKLEKQVKLFAKESDDIGLIHCGYEKIDENGNILIPKKKLKETGNMFYELLESNIIGSPTNLIRSECFKKIGYCDVQLKSCQDWDLWIRISKHYKINYIPEILARYNVSDVSISKNIDSVLSGHKQILDKYFLYICKNNKIHSKHMKDIGLLYLHKGDYSKSLKYLTLSIHYNPLNWKSVINYLTIRFFKKSAGNYLRLVKNLI